jgi:hypothetical protein
VLVTRLLRALVIGDGVIGVSCYRDAQFRVVGERITCALTAAQTAKKRVNEK